MNRSVLLHLLPPSRTGSRLAGVAEIVATGERALFRDADDLVQVLRRIHDQGPDVAPALTPSQLDEQAPTSIARTERA